MLANFWTATHTLATSLIAEYLAAIALICLLITAALIGLRAFSRWAARNVETAVQNALATEAADWGEPTRAQVESGWLDEANEFWLFPAPESVDESTPIADSVDFDMWEREWSA